jgi:hypothetical protein
MEGGKGQPVQDKINPDDVNGKQIKQDTEVKHSSTHLSVLYSFVVHFHI